MPVSTPMTISLCSCSTSGSVVVASATHFSLFLLIRRMPFSPTGISPQQAILICLVLVPSQIGMMSVPKQTSFCVGSVLAHLQLPILVIPLRKRLFENGDTTKLKGSVIDRLGISYDLILNGAGQGSGEILGAKTFGKHLRVMSLNNHIDAIDIFLAMFTQDTSLIFRRIEPDLDSILQTFRLLLLLLFWLSLNHVWTAFQCIFGLFHRSHLLLYYRTLIVVHKLGILAKCGNSFLI